MIIQKRPSCPMGYIQVNLIYLTKSLFAREPYREQFETVRGVTSFKVERFW